MASGTTTTTVLGHAVERREDPGLLTGETKFLDDVDIAGALHAVFVRSTVAHALVRDIDVSAATALDGVHSVVTAAELALEPAGSPRQPALARPRLASDRVRFVGEPVAVVLASTRAQATDAAEAVVIDYEPLPAVVDPMAAMEAGAPLLFPDHGSNVVLDAGQGSDTGDDFFDDADVVVKCTFHNHRVAPVPLEPNGCIAVPDTDDGLTVWASTQSVFGVRRELTRVLDMPEARVRVRAAAVGGGFGAKGGVYQEQVIVAALARSTGRPVRWHETRTENLLSMTHGRGQVQEVELGAKCDGTLTALRVRAIADTGAYSTRGAFIPMVTQFMSSGTYRIPKIAFRPVVVVTNTTPTGPYRGAGRPEAAALIERAIDLLASELELDAVDVRRKNFIPPDAFPFRTATGAEYDCGEYEKALDAALKAADYKALRAEQSSRRERGDQHLLGIGVASYVEVSGRGGEYGAVRVEEDGTFTVVTGSSPHGQGHETAWSQIASAVLGVPMERIRVIHSDTSLVPRGVGTFGSRSLQLAGTAVHRASEAVLAKAREVAADMLEASPDDIVVFEDGNVGVAGTPASGRTWADLAKAARERDDGEGLAAEIDVDQQGTFPFGTHIAVVELDTETGKVDLQRLIAVDDCGRVVNPLLAEGQVHGGIAQGVAQALFEQVVYDDDGNPLTSTLVDYAMPTAVEFPSFETSHTETLTPRNELGVKGIGESGTTGSTAAVWNAVVDALRPFGVRHLDPPFTPEKVWRAIQRN